MVAAGRELLELGLQPAGVLGISDVVGRGKSGIHSDSDTRGGEGCV